MILRIILYISLFLACCSVRAQEWNAGSERPVENGRWICWEYSGKGQRAREIIDAKPLEYFTRQLADFDAEIGWRKANDKLQDWSKIRSTINTVGLFAGEQVVDIFYYAAEDDKRTKAFGKMVLIGNNNQFRPVIWILDENGVAFSASEIKVVQGITVLATRSRIDGSGNYYYEDYFGFDQKNKTPVNFRPDDAIELATKKNLPAGHGVWKGGGFDLDNMVYKHSVWKDGDSNCCPSGGTIKLQLQFKRNRIVVSKSSYLPAKAEQ